MSVSRLDGAVQCDAALRKPSKCSCRNTVLGAGVSCFLPERIVDSVKVFLQEHCGKLA
jgi:hypothetical protein